MLRERSWRVIVGYDAVAVCALVVSVVSVVQKKIIGQIKLYGNLPYKCSIQKKGQIQLFVRDRMNSICPMNFFRTTDTTDTTDTTILKPAFKQIFVFCTFRRNAMFVSKCLGMFFGVKLFA